MRSYAEIYQSLKDTTNGRFTTLEVLKIFKEEKGNWVGSPQQLMQITSISHELTGIRVGSCSGCQITAVNNLIKWLDNHEQTILNQLTLEKAGKQKQKE